MASDPITSWQIEREKVETVTDFLLLGSKITVNDDCRHEIKRRLFLGRKPVTSLESILKNRHHFADKGPYSQSYNFSSSHAWLWETVKKAEGQRVDVFELWCWRRLLGLLWTERRSNQSILKEISPEYSFQGLMLKLKLQYFGHVMRQADSLEKTMMLGKIEGKRKRGQQRMRWLDSFTASVDMNLSKLDKIVEDGHGML